MDGMNVGGFDACTRLVALMLAKARSSLADAGRVLLLRPRCPNPRAACHSRRREILTAALEVRPEWGLDSRTGYEFDGAREVMLRKKIADTELGWCLGAGIKFIGDVDVQCRVGHGVGCRPWNFIRWI
ncbi:hypothetical protein FB451DRAFT_1552339 [Mycena latifolia]|nr:hypothetical protein FB451DRAFT_1552339 [Mycena latifolia]